MNINKAYYIKCFLITVLLCFFASPSKAQDNISDVFRENEKKFIDEHYTGYRLLKITDLDSWSQKIIREDYQNQPLFLIREDFDGNTLDDFACLLYNDEIKNLVFGIFLMSTNCSYEISFNRERSASRWGEDVILLLLKTGETIVSIEAIEPDEREITLKNPGVEFVNIGKASTAYYWNNKKQEFISIATSD